MAERKHEAEQAVHLRAVMGHVDAIKIEIQDGVSEARRAALDQALAILGAVYNAPFRYADWRPMDDLARLGGGGMTAARKGVRELGARGVLQMRGAVKGPANTRVKLAALPPYPME